MPICDETRGGLKKGHPWPVLAARKQQSVTVSGKPSVGVWWLAWYMLDVVPRCQMAILTAIGFVKFRVYRGGLWLVLDCWMLYLDVIRSSSALDGIGVCEVSRIWRSVVCLGLDVGCCIQMSFGAAALWTAIGFVECSSTRAIVTICLLEPLFALCALWRFLSCAGICMDLRVCVLFILPRRRIHARRAPPTGCCATVCGLRCDAWQ